MKISTKAVHAGDRKKGPSEIPVTTPIYSAAGYISEKTEQLDRIFAHEVEGLSYARYGNPTTAALEELVTSLEGGHGDVLGGVVVSDLAHLETLRTLARTYGPLLGAFEAYMAMRGIKTFPLRMERQCANAARLAAWLRQDPRIERVVYPGDPLHPDRAAVRRLFSENLRGATVSFAIKNAGRERIFAFMDRLKLVVRATSLGDVHSMILYPVISSHREVPLADRERLGITENLVRLSAGIEDVEDVITDLDHALA